MNIKHAQYMLTVMQEGSITAAAKKLYISQPSLSQMIKLVETNLGTPIFNRSTDPITLTYAGEKYIEAAKDLEGKGFDPTTTCKRRLTRSTTRTTAA